MDRNTMWRILDDDMGYMKRFAELVSRLSDFKTRMGGEKEKEIEEVIQLVLLEIGKMS